MFRMIGGDHQEYGPVTADTLRHWIRDGRANAHSRVREAEGDWKPLGSLRDFAPELMAQASKLENRRTWVVPLSNEEYAEEILECDYAINVGACLHRSWILLRANLLPLTIATTLAIATVACINALPIIGLIASLILLGPLWGGLFSIYLKRLRGQVCDFSEVYGGVSGKYLQLMLAMVVSFCLMAISGLITISSLVMAAVMGTKFPAPALVFASLIGILPFIYFAVCWMFTVPLVIDKNLEFWPAMELSRKKVNQHWWEVFRLLVAGLVVALAGVLGLGIGVFITIPVFIGAVACTYEDIFTTPTTLM